MGYRKQVILCVIAAGLVLIALLPWQKLSNQSSGKTQAVNIPIALPQPRLIHTTEAQAQAPVTANHIATPDTNTANPAPASTPDQAGLSPAATAVGSSTIAPMDAEGGETPVNANNPSANAATSTMANHITSAINTETTSNTSPVQATTQLPVNNAMNTSTPTENTMPKVSASEVTTTLPVENTKPKASTPAVVAQAKPKATTVATPKKVAAISPKGVTTGPNDYTVQLIRLGTEAQVKNFIAENKLQGKVRSVKNNNTYVVLYGRYPNSQQANLAIKNLAPELKKAGPWARKVSDF